MGATLDQLSIVTCDENGNKKYIDRTDKKYSLEPLRKSLTLQNFGIYWITNSEIFGSESAPRIKEKLQKMIIKEYRDGNKKKDGYIIAISATSRLIQKNKKNPKTKDDPEYDVSLDLKPLDLSLKKPQLENLISFLEYLNSYWRYKLKIQLDRNLALKNISEEDKVKNKAEFQALFEKFQRFES